MTICHSLHGNWDDYCWELDCCGDHVVGDADGEVEHDHEDQSEDDKAGQGNPGGNVEPFQDEEPNIAIALAHWGREDVLKTAQM